MSVATTKEKYLLHIWRFRGTFFFLSPTSIPLILRGGKKSLKKQRQRKNSLDKIPSCTKLVGSSVQAKNPYLVTGNGTISRKTGSKKPNPTRLLFLFY
jgi:hypothetical protein